MNFSQALDEMARERQPHSKPWWAVECYWYQPDEWMLHQQLPDEVALAKMAGPIKAGELALIAGVVVEFGERQGLSATQKENQ